MDSYGKVPKKYKPAIAMLDAGANGVSVCMMPGVGVRYELLGGDIEYDIEVEFLRRKP